ncbi:aminoglycoside phosphotransferase family protein [Leifsonia aquatica]|uniref:aminoglycoside phosphotransferase family protein n=1 Tax=Leifsonia aquatica TaxID=144185 RepID=UPI001F062336|nr:aminoglycoside phosphotransferase family protein [Leifsonia aquatica]
MQPVIDAALVRRLVDTQFPQWRDLPIAPVEHDGWDNRTFRLGDDLSVRLPSAAGYTVQVAKEQEWLPRLAPQLPLPIPQPVAAGVPGEGYPFPWSVYRWLPGRALVLALAAGDGDGGDGREEVDEVVLARDLGAFLVALRQADAADGPEPGPLTALRGAPPGVYGDEAVAAIALLGDDAPRARALWDRAIVSRWEAAPVWFHGDVAEGNLLVDAGRLSAVIDFGTSGVGDPACDLVPAWTLFEEPARAAFRAAAGLDADTWVRARGWALWKAAITLRDRPDDAPSRTTLRRLLADPA